MAVKNKKKKAQMMILNEVKQQLMLQAERWGRTGYYTPLKLEEMELDACNRIRGDLLAERANLEYELQIIETNRREIEMKLHRLDMYIRKADRVSEAHDKSINRTIDRLVGDKKKTMGALERLKFERSGLVSVVMSDN
jgi:hypothetical protein